MLPRLAENRRNTSNSNEYDDPKNLFTMLDRRMEDRRYVWFYLHESVTPNIRTSLENMITVNSTYFDFPKLW